METRLEKVTPKFAANAIETLNEHNRRRRGWFVDELARAIGEGRWRVTHQGIAFNCDGTLIDGQHRLAAIVKANKPVMMYVTRGLPRDAVFAVDQGVVRNLQDMSSAIGNGTNISKAEGAIARAMICGVDPTNFTASRMKMSTEELLAFCLRHREAIQWAIENAKHKIVEVAPIRAAIARAYYHENRERLAEFCAVLSSGVATEEGDTAAAMLREVAVRTPSTGAPARAELYAKTECAIEFFRRRKRPGCLKAVTKERYPLPEVEA